MKNVIKAQLYQIVRQRNFRALFFGFLALAVLFGGSGRIFDYDEQVTASEFITSGYVKVVCNLLPLLCAITVSFICADDFVDKTANYELLSGTLRRDIFFGKVITSVAMSLVCSVLYLLTAVLLDCLFFGWGTCITVGNFVLRSFLLLISLTRISCFYILLAFVVKNHAAVVGIAYALMCVQVLLMDSEGREEPLMLGSATVLKLFDFGAWYTFALDGETYYVYETDLSAGKIAVYIIIPIIFTAVYLLLGYTFFHDDDIE